MTTVYLPYPTKNIPDDIDVAMERQQEIVEWLDTHVGSAGWDYDYLEVNGVSMDCFTIEDESAALLFKLTWGGNG